MLWSIVASAGSPAPAVAHDSCVGDRERREVDELVDSRMHAGLGDHRTAVGMTDEHDRGLELIEDLPYPRRITVQVGELTPIVAVARQVDGHHVDARWRAIRRRPVPNTTRRATHRARARRVAGIAQPFVVVDAGTVVFTVPVGSARDTPGAVGGWLSVLPHPTANAATATTITAMAPARFLMSRSLAGPGSSRVGPRVRHRVRR